MESAESETHLALGAFTALAWARMITGVHMSTILLTGPDICHSWQEHLLSDSCIRDVRIVCRDGTVLWNSLALAQWSPYLRYLVAQSQERQCQDCEPQGTLLLPDVSARALRFVLLWSVQQGQAAVPMADLEQVQELFLLFGVEVDVSKISSNGGRTEEECASCGGAFDDEDAFQVHVRKCRAVFDLHRDSAVPQPTEDDVTVFVNCGGDEDLQDSAAVEFPLENGLFEEDVDVEVGGSSPSQGARSSCSKSDTNSDGVTLYDFKGAVKRHGTMSFPCPAGCHRKFFSSEKLLQHLSVAHFRQELLFEFLEEVKVDGEFHCLWCPSFQSESEKGFLEHRGASHGHVLPLVFRSRGEMSAYFSEGPKARGTKRRVISSRAGRNEPSLAEKGKVMLESADKDFGDIIACGGDPDKLESVMKRFFSRYFHSDNKHVSSYLWCTQCPRYDHSYRGWVDHEVVHLLGELSSSCLETLSAPEDNDVWQCQKCPARKSGLAEIAKHVGATHREVLAHIPALSNKECYVEYLRKCAELEQEQYSKFGAVPLGLQANNGEKRRASKLVHAGSCVCPMCSQAYTHINYLKTHMASAHFQEQLVNSFWDRKIGCTLCGKKTAGVRKSFAAHAGLLHNKVLEVLPPELRVWMERLEEEAKKRKMAAAEETAAKKRK